MSMRAFTTSVNKPSVSSMIGQLTSFRKGLHEGVHDAEDERERQDRADSARVNAGHERSRGPERGGIDENAQDDFHVANLAPHSSLTKACRAPRPGERHG